MEAKNCPQIEEELEPKWEKPKTTSDTKSKKPISTFGENRKPSAKIRKYANYNKHQNCKTEVFLAHNRRTDLKKMTNTVKLKIPMPPSLLILRY